MKLPNDPKLPFFTYGIFKPGQLCFSRIQAFVRKKEKVSIGGHLRERDGIPLLILGENALNIIGYLLDFDSGNEVKAYSRIIGIEPNKVYQWHETIVGSRNVNILIGRRELRGSSDLEYIVEWDGSNDPYFKQGIEEVENILHENQKFDIDFRSLFRLQMAYSLLWSSIERYTGLKYHLGKDIVEKVSQLAKEVYFSSALKNVVSERREVFSTTDLKKYTLDPDNPQKSLKYYYQVRSNSIHRGKAVVHDFNTIRSSLIELLAIFKIVLNKSFK